MDAELVARGTLDGPFGGAARCPEAGRRPAGNVFFTDGRVDGLSGETRRSEVTRAREVFKRLPTPRGSWTCRARTSRRLRTPHWEKICAGGCFERWLAVARPTTDRSRRQRHRQRLTRSRGRCFFARSVASAVTSLEILPSSCCAVVTSLARRRSSMPRNVYATNVPAVADASSGGEANVRLIIALDGHSAH